MFNRLVADEIYLRIIIESYFYPCQENKFKDNEKHLKEWIDKYKETIKQLGDDYKPNRVNNDISKRLWITRCRIVYNKEVTLDEFKTIDEILKDYTD